jgi:hypothetical protein
MKYEKDKRKKGLLALLGVEREPETVYQGGDGKSQASSYCGLTGRSIEAYAFPVISSSCCCLF